MAIPNLLRGNFMTWMSQSDLDCFSRCCHFALPPTIPLGISNRRPPPPSLCEFYKIIAMPMQHPVNTCKTTYSHKCTSQFPWQFPWETKRASLGVKIRKGLQNRQSSPYWSSVHYVHIEIVCIIMYDDNLRFCIIIVACFSPRVHIDNLYNESCSPTPPQHESSGTSGLKKRDGKIQMYKFWICHKKNIEVRWKEIEGINS